MNMIFEINCNNKAQDRIEIKSLFIMLIIGDMRTCQFGFGRVENWVVDGRFSFLMLMCIVLLKRILN